VASLSMLIGAGCDSKMITPPGDGGPDLTITSPGNGDPVSGAGFLVEVDAMDDDGVARVEFTVDGGPVATDTSAPYSTHVVTLAMAADTPVTVQVRAYDEDGNSTTRSVDVTVSARTLTQLTTDVNDDLNPAWSPDGMSIAFQADRNGAQFDLWMMDATGAGQTRLTTDVNEDRNPAFSPDGNWIAFDSDREGSFDIWLLPLATGEIDATNETFGNLDDVEPAWSAGGTSIYFASSRGDGTFNIWSQVLATGGVSQLTSFAADDRAPAVSRDGMRLAFTSSLNFAVPHVYTKRLGSVEVTPLTGDVGITESDPAWGPAGPVVSFGRDAGLDGNVWFKRDGVEESAVQGTFGSGTVGDGGPAWSPDGTKLAFHSDRDGNLDIWLIQ
jgi:Tol biopolymer transport system component